MNYNPQFDNQNQYAQPVEKNAKYYRAKAREALTGFWWKAILVTLIAALLGGVAVGGVSCNFNFNFGGSNVDDPTYEEDVYEEEEGDLTLTEEQSAAMAEALANGDFATVKAIFNEADPMFSVVFTVIGVIFFVVLAGALGFAYLVGSPVKLGYHKFFLHAVDGNESGIRVGTLFDFFRNGYGKSVCLSLLHDLIINATMLPFYILTGIGMSRFFQSIFAAAFITGANEEMVMATVVTTLFSMMGLMMLGLGISMVICIPVSYMYSMAHFIMADYPSVGVVEALRSSRNMMKGNKFRLFCLELSFIGWEFLAVCACGIGTYAVTPYQYAARAAFYNDISGRESHKEVEFPSINPGDYVIE